MEYTRFCILTVIMVFSPVYSNLIPIYEKTKLIYLNILQMFTNFFVVCSKAYTIYRTLGKYTLS